jgi:hypothetical protein
LKMPEFDAFPSNPVRRWPGGISHQRTIAV